MARAGASGRTRPPQASARDAASAPAGARLADAMLALRDEQGAPVFPPGGTRALAYPGADHATTDGSGGHALCYFNLRMGAGRSAVVHQAAGDALTAVARAHFAPMLASRTIGLTLQVDEGREVFDAKFGNLHPLFAAR